MIMSTTLHPDPIERERAAFAERLSALGAVEPLFTSTIWRLWLPRSAAGALLDDLDRYAIPTRVAVAFESRGVYLYLWPQMPSPALYWLLQSYSAGASLVNADAIRASAVWACGKAARRLLRPRVGAERAREVGA